MKMNLFLYFNISRTNLSVFLAILFFTIKAPSYAHITGVITDKMSREPVIGASVYINNTTYGCKTDADGHFNLTTFPAPPFKIVISSVGYESVILNIKSNKDSNVDIVLVPRIQNLNEVVILSPEKDGWAKYGKEFIADFIGYSSFADECEIINKEVLEFRYDKNRIQLSVSAREPLKIKNKATGYMLTYWLDNYEKDYQTHRLYYKGNVQFESLQSQKEKDNKRWGVNRQSAYLGSLTHFMRSVYSNTVYENGFELRVYRILPAEEYGKTVPFRTDIITANNDSLIRKAIKEFLHYPPEELPQFATSIEKWSALTETNQYLFTIIEKAGNHSDNITKSILFCFNPENHTERWIQYFDSNFTPEDTTYNRMTKNFKVTNTAGGAFSFPRIKKTSYAYLWKQKIPLDSFVTRSEDHKVILKFKDYIQVTYLKEKEEKRYIQAQFARKSRTPEYQQSLLTLENPDGVQVFADGNYFESYDLITEDYWSYEKIDKMLPLNYQGPE